MTAETPGSPAGANPAGPAPVLLLSGRPDRLNRLRDELRSTALGQRILETFVFDGVQVFKADDAKIALARGYDGRPHRLLLIEGDVAGSMNARQLADLKAASLVNIYLVVIGLAETAEEHTRLSALGVKRVCNPSNFAEDFKIQMPAARQDIQVEYAKLQEELARAAAPTTEIEIERNPTGGLRPDGGVIAVHATKGGSGKTTIATNIAWALARGGKPTVLVDLNPDGAADHLHFWSWISKQEGLENPEELFEYKGLTQLARRIEHGQAFTIKPEQLEKAILVIEDKRLHADSRHPSTLAILPGVEDQADYAIGTEGGDRQISKLLSQNRWVENLIDMLSAPSGGWRYVVLDTGTNRYTSPGLISVSRADIVMIVVDATTWRDVRIESAAWRRLLDPTRGASFPMRAKRVLVINKLGKDPGAPTFDKVVKEYEFLGAEYILPVRSDLPAIIAADRAGQPLLADPTRATQSPAGQDMIAVVNTISSVYTVSGGDKKRRGLFGKRS